MLHLGRLRAHDRELIGWSLDSSWSNRHAPPGTVIRPPAPNSCRRDHGQRVRGSCSPGILLVSLTSFRDDDEEWKTETNSVCNGGRLEVRHVHAHGQTVGVIFQWAVPTGAIPATEVPTQSVCCCCMTWISLPVFHYLLWRRIQRNALHDVIDTHTSP